jgi:hypothetical protein
MGKRDNGLGQAGHGPKGQEPRVSHRAGGGQGGAVGLGFPLGPMPPTPSPYYINPSLGALGSFIPSSSSLPPDLVPMFGIASAG